MRSSLLISVFLNGEQDIYPQLIPIHWILIAKTLLEARLVLACKNDTNVPAVSELWVSKVWTGSGQMGKCPGKRQNISLKGSKFRKVIGNSGG